MALVARLNTTRPVEQSDLNPVGMIVQSMLTEAQFQALNGTNWILADGRSVAGSAYATVTGNSTAPDARGLFLRSAGSQTVNDGVYNKTYSATLGNRQTDRTAVNGISASQAAHQHQGYTTSSGGSGLSASYTSGTASTASTSFSGVPVTPAITVSSSHAETQPANLAVNVFIKIN